MVARTRVLLTTVGRHTSCYGAVPVAAAPPRVPDYVDLVRDEPAWMATGMIDALCGNWPERAARVSSLSCGLRLYPFDLGGISFNRKAQKQLARRLPRHSKGAGRKMNRLNLSPGGTAASLKATNDRCETELRESSSYWAFILP